MSKRIRLGAPVLLPLMLMALVAGCDGKDVSRSGLEPAVVAHLPEADATLVPNDAVVQATFNQAMDPATLTPASFAVACPAGIAMPGVVSYDAASRTATFAPSGHLPSDESCAVTITTAAADTSRRALTAAVTWSFETATDTALIAEGRQVFRFDTFGDETQWTDTLRMHEVIRTAVDPVTALSVGLKVDAEALPPAVVQGIQDGSISLTTPDTTVALIGLNAVVGVVGTVENIDGKAKLVRVGITCALCHSTVDDSFAPGIGRRLDGWPNRDLDPGAIIALSPALSAEQKAVYNSWGKGKYDPRYNFDGLNGPQVIPPAFGLKGVHRITSTGDGGDIAYWNRYVGVTQMGGHGSFSEPRLGIAVTNGTDDLISAKLPALQAYQLSLAAPPPPAGSFDAEAAARGQAVFEGAARCSTCHHGAELTDANERLHDPSEVMSEPEPEGVTSYASRSATGSYRTAPLRGIWQHPPYFHNGSAATLEEVVSLYDARQGLALTEGQRADLVQYLRSL